MKYRFIFYFVISLLFLSSCGTSTYSVQKQANRETARIIDFAGTFTGTPYLQGGSTPKAFDCSGFTQYVFGAFNYRLPRTTEDQSVVGIGIETKDIKPGDLVFFTGSNAKNRRVGHVGIVVDSNRKGYFIFILASSSGVTVNSSLESYYRQRYLWARRVVNYKL